MILRRAGLACCGLVMLAASAAAQPAATRVTVEQLECLPLGRHGVVRADIEGGAPGYTARVHFRRLNEEVEDFYWVSMQASEGRWWAALPQPEDHPLKRHDLARDARAERPQLDSAQRWAAWWKAKELSDHRDPNVDLDEKVIEERAQLGKAETRDWMLGRDDPSLEQWLDTLEYEPVEYFAAVYDSYGEQVARSPMSVTPVTDDCALELTPQEAGAANNLTIGESAPWQEGKPPFHWACHGVVTRVDEQMIPRADEACRHCVVAFLLKEEAVAAAAVLTAITVLVDEPNPSPVRPQS
jgi:hypothetical protein